MIEVAFENIFASESQANARIEQGLISRLGAAQTSSSWPPAFKARQKSHAITLSRVTGERGDIDLICYEPQERSNALSLPSLDVEIRFRPSSTGVRLQLPLIVPQNVLTKRHPVPEPTRL